MWKNVSLRLGEERDDVTSVIIKLKSEGLEQKIKRGRLSKIDKIPNVEKGGSSQGTFTKQMQKNKSNSEESDIKAEKVMSGY